MKNSFLERLVKEKYVQTSFERDIDMYMEAVKGSPLSLTAVTGQFSASISGSEVTKALKQPADYEDVKSKLIMTGNTGYKVSGIELHMDNDVFLSVGELKKLRREVIAQLDNNILSSYCRTYKEPDDSIINPCCMTYNEQDNSILSSDCDAHNEYHNNCTGIESQYNDVSDNAGKMLYTVYCHSFDIVSSVIDIVSSPDNKLDIAVGRIYLGFGMYYSDRQRFIKVCEKINKIGIKLFIALPYILEQSRARQLSTMLDDIEHNTGIIIDGYLVRNIEEIGLIGSRKSKVKDIITDTGLYVFNKYSGYELKDIADKAGVRLLSHTLPLELNNSELQDTLTAGSEIIVYGKIPAMVSKSCVRKTYGICDKKCSTTLLKQGSDISYIVESVCSYCYTVTWAGTFDLTEELKRNDLGVRSLRFEFIDEDTFTIKKVHGRGYDTVADAKLSKPSNTDLDFEITVDDSNSYEIIANNDYYLGVSNSVFIAYSPDDASTYEAFKVITDCEKAFPDARTITDNMAEADNSFALSSPADGKLPIVASTSPRVTPVSVLIQSWLMYSEVGQSFEGRDKVNAYITLKLGNLEKQVHIRRRAAIDAGGTILKYMPANSYPFPTTGEVDYHCLTGEVEDGTDNPKEWIKLLPSSMVDRNDTDKIIVEDGHIYIKIMPNTASTTRNGIVYLTTIMPGSLYTSTVKRIKIDITQKGN
jgi:hypothetical protein